MSVNDQNKPKEPRAFNGSDIRKLRQAVVDLRDTQLGALMQPFTSPELQELFCPKDYRASLQLVYKLESRIEARGEIYLDLRQLIRETGNKNWLFDEDRQAFSNVNRAVMKLYFHRDIMPDGFVTPTPVFGELGTPVTIYKGSVNEVMRKVFADRAQAMLRCTGEWLFVLWVLQKLQNSVRTPPQVRYVWPAIQTLSKVAGLEMDLTQASVRAGLNAVPDPECAPFLRATNDIVANSVLLGTNNELMLRYRRNEMFIADVGFSLGDTPKMISCSND